MERTRGASLRMEEQYEYHIGRLKQDRVHIPRKEDEVNHHYGNTTARQLRSIKYNYRLFLQLLYISREFFVSQGMVVDSTM